MVAGEELQCRRYSYYRFMYRYNNERRFNVAGFPKPRVLQLFGFYSKKLGLIQPK